MYEALLKAATGNNNLKFKVINAPFPASKQFKDRAAQVDGMFIVFVVAIGFALIPSSIISYILYERDKNLKHMQWISGLNLSAYWISNYIFDICKAFVTMGLVIALLYIFDLGYANVWILFLLYPFGVIPFTYATSFMFSGELAAQTVTIFIHFVLSGIGGIVVFILRIIPETQSIGDMLLWIFKICPSFCLTNSIMFASSKSRLILFREDINNDDFAMENMKGDIMVMMIHFVVWTIVVIVLESGLLKFLKRISFCKGSVKPIQDMKLDEDVVEEEQRINKYVRDHFKQDSDD